MAALDFPAAPVNGQVFTGVGGINWVWDGAKWNPGTSLSAGQFLPLAGGTMVGPIVLPGPPTQPLQAATKGYVDNAIANSAVVVSDTAPTLTNGFLWFNSADTQLYIGYNDGNSSQWVVANNLGVSQGPYLPLTGGTLTGDLTITSPVNTHAQIFLNKSTTGANSNIIWGRRNSLNRWNIDLGNADAESAGNAGSNFGINRWNDAGNLIDTPLSINRATGVVTSQNNLVVQGDNISVAPATGDANLVLRRAAASAQVAIQAFTTTSQRWTVLLASNEPETGGNAGSNFYIQRFSDTGSYIDNVFDINRSSGTATFRKPLQVITSGVGGYIFSSVPARTWYHGVASDGSMFQVVDSTASAFRITIDNTGACKNLTGTWSALSDASVKTDIQDHPRGLADILNLQPRTFRYTGKLDDGQVHQGFVAQEIEAFFPELVGETPFDPPQFDENGAQREAEQVVVKTVDPTATIYAVINALKEIDTRLKAGGL